MKDIFEFVVPSVYLSSDENGNQIKVIDFANGKEKKIDENTAAHILCISKKSKYPFMKYIIKGIPIDFSAINMSISMDTNNTNSSNGGL